MAKKAKKLKAAFDEMLKNPIDDISVTLPDDSDLSVWHASIIGPEKTPYEGGTYIVEFKFDKGYPNKPPQTKMKTKIYHMNINRSGKICIAIFDKEWNAKCTVGDILGEVYECLCEPMPDAAIFLDALTLYVEHRDKYDEIAREFNAKYANGPQVNNNNNDDEKEKELAKDKDGDKAVNNKNNPNNPPADNIQVWSM